MLSRVLLSLLWLSLIPRIAQAEDDIVVEIEGEERTRVSIELGADDPDLLDRDCQELGRQVAAVIQKLAGTEVRPEAKLEPGEAIDLGQGRVLYAADCTVEFSPAAQVQESKFRR